MISQMRNKWYKHRFLSRYPALKKFLPETHLYSKSVFWKLLKRDKEVIIKPSRGSGGIGVVKISEMKNEIYEVHIENKRELIKGRKKLERYLARIKGSRTTLVQYCIPLATIDGMPLNFRYLVQRQRGKSNWEITGKHGKVAKQGYFITNVQVGSHIVTVEDALLKSNIKDLNLEKTLAELDQLALTLSKYLTVRFKSHCMWGYDFAIDINGRVWVIEANCGAQVTAFRAMEDTSMIKKIDSYITYNSRNR